MTLELVKYTLRVANREYEGQTSRILGQQGRGFRHLDMLYRMRIQYKRVVGKSDEGLTRQGASERIG